MADDIFAPLPGARSALKPAAPKMPRLTVTHGATATRQCWTYAPAGE
jgi:hypothetical protein